MAKQVGNKFRVRKGGGRATVRKGLAERTGVDVDKELKAAEQGSGNASTAWPSRRRASRKDKPRFQQICFPVAKNSFRTSLLDSP